jgi:hypothetical protein
MKVPNLEQAVIPEKKLTAYLLDFQHPVGGGKAKFFLQQGFGPEDWLKLAEKLTKHLCENEVSKIEMNLHGTKYIVDGLFEKPDGASLNLRTAWFIRTNESVPVFVTAYPLPRKL